MPYRSGCTRFNNQIDHLSAIRTPALTGRLGSSSACKNTLIFLQWYSSVESVCPILTCSPSQQWSRSFWTSSCSKNECSEYKIWNISSFLLRRLPTSKNITLFAIQTVVAVVHDSQFRKNHAECLFSAYLRAYKPAPCTQLMDISAINS